MEKHLLSENPIVISSLLGSFIYHIQDEKSPIKEVDQTNLEEKVFEYLGENNKYILMIVNHLHEKEFINKTDLELLNKTLTALKLELRDVAILNYHHYQSTSLKELLSYFSANKIIVFGANILLDGINKDQIVNSIDSFEGKPILRCSSLTELANNQDLKIVWWSAIKSIIS